MDEIIFFFLNFESLFFFFSNSIIEMLISKDFDSILYDRLITHNNNNNFNRRKNI